MRIPALIMIALLGGLSITSSSFGQSANGTDDDQTQTIKFTTHDGVVQCHSVAGDPNHPDHSIHICKGVFKDTPVIVRVDYFDGKVERVRSWNHLGLNFGTDDQYCLDGKTVWSRITYDDLETNNDIGIKHTRGIKYTRYSGSACKNKLKRMNKQVLTAMHHPDVPVRTPWKERFHYPSFCHKRPCSAKGKNR